MCNGVYLVGYCLHSIVDEANKYMTYRKCSSIGDTLWIIWSLSPCVCVELCSVPVTHCLTFLLLSSLHLSSDPAVPSFNFIFEGSKAKEKGQQGQYNYGYMRCDCSV